MIMEQEKEEKDLRRRRLIASIGGGLSAMANMAVTLAGAPSSDVSDRVASLTDRVRRIYDRETERADRRADRESRETLARVRQQADLGLRQRREERQEKESEERILSMRRQAGSREAADRRADRIAESRIADTESRIAVRQAASAKPKPSSRSASRRESSFTWVHPDTGENYRVSRSTWDKSSYTIFQMVVDATRPKPDKRGYPSQEEWRRYCFDTYSSADRRDAYIMRHLPVVPAALDYLKRLGKANDKSD